MPTLLLLLALPHALAETPSTTGYYRQPTLRGDTVVFVSEGDLWRGSLTGDGRATRLTSHPGYEYAPFLSPDGTSIAFVGSYDGAPAAYVMPTAGGLPQRLTWDGTRVNVVGWSRDGKVLVATDALAGMPAIQLTRLDPKTQTREIVPLAQAADGTYTAEGVLVFTRLPFQGSQTARYQGGTAQNLWRWDPSKPDGEAVPLTSDYAGTSKNPMAHNGKIYFLTDRDGTMNLWSMAEDGTGLAQLTRSVGWDIQSASLDGSASGARIAYRIGADIRVFDVATGSDTPVPLTLESDLDQTRERWIDHPHDWISAVDLSSDGEKIAITARGKIWVVPKTPGRIVSLTPESGVRWRNAQFSPDGKTVVGLSDASGEVELAELPADGSGTVTPLTTGGDVLRWDHVSSPDGSLIAHTDKNQRLWLYSRATGKSTLIATATYDIPGPMVFSPDGKTLAWVEIGENQLKQIHLLDVATVTRRVVTTARYESYSPAFSPDGHWLYFLSDRNFESSVGSPWGNYAPQPYFDHRTGIYALALQPDQVSPFKPFDELRAGPPPEEEEDEKDKKKGKKKQEPAEPLPAIVGEGLATRIWTVPVAPGNYDALSVNEGGLYWLSWEGSGEDVKPELRGLVVGNDPPEVKTLVAGIEGYALSRDGKRLLIQKDSTFHIVDAAISELDLAKSAVDLGGWTFALTPQEEWRQMFVESWRLERDYFYATNMHGVDWKAVLDRYLPLVDRVRTRGELSDAISQMVSQLSALHTFVYGGDARTGPEWVAGGELGARFSATPEGLRVDRILQGDPDLLDRRSPLQAPGLDVRVGDVIESVDHQAVRTERDLADSLRNKPGRQVLLGYRRDAIDARGKRTVVALQALVVPLDPGAMRDLRYLDWEIGRRSLVEEKGEGRIGYVHLRAMGKGDIAEWTRSYYPMFTRDGLIIDVRNNRGGNIDSWILGQLLRRPWFYWNQRVGESRSWNMQGAFRGPVVVLCDESTASDGEAFSEGVKRLGIGKLIGTRTWGGEIWLSSSNVLVDGGIATAAEFGVFGPEGDWLIEGHGVEPDQVVDNLPRATFLGGDAQLDAALAYLAEELKKNPVPPIVVPPLPVKTGVEPGK